MAVDVGMLAISNPNDDRLLGGEYRIFSEISSNGLFLDICESMVQYDTSLRKKKEKVSFCLKQIVNKSFLLLYTKRII